MKKIVLLILGYSVNMSLSALGISNPTTLSSQKEEVWASKAAINNNGAATVVWIKSQGQDLYSLQASTRANSELSWDQAQAISEPMKISTFLPSVAADGTSTIIWTTDIKKTQQYYYTQKKKSNSWLPAEAIDHNPKDVIVDFNGDPFWLTSFSDQIEIYSYCKSGEKKKLPNQEQAYNPFLLKNLKGKIIALWGNKQWVRNDYSIHGHYDYHFNYAFYEAGTWSQKTDQGRLHFTNLDKDKVSSISAFLNNKDIIAVFWSHFESSQYQHKLKAIVNCEDAVTIKKSQDGFTNNAIWVDDDNNAVAVWIEPFNKQNVVYAAFRPQNQKEWQGEQALSNINNNAEHVQLSFSNGVFVVVWGESDNAAYKRSIFGATLAPKSEKFRWSESVQLSPEEESCWYPSIAFGEKGGIITWTSHVKYSPHFQIQVANLTAP